MCTNRVMGHFFLSAVVLMALLAATVQAQVANTGSVLGTVTDS